MGKKSVKKNMKKNMKKTEELIEAELLKQGCSEEKIEAVSKEVSRVEAESIEAEAEAELEAETVAMAIEAEAELDAKVEKANTLDSSQRASTTIPALTASITGETNGGFGTEKDYDSFDDIQEVLEKMVQGHLAAVTAAETQHFWHEHLQPVCVEWLRLRQAKAGDGPMDKYDVKSLTDVIYEAAGYITSANDATDAEKKSHTFNIQSDAFKRTADLAARAAVLEYYGDLKITRVEYQVNAKTGKVLIWHLRAPANQLLPTLVDDDGKDYDNPDSTVRRISGADVLRVYARVHKTERGAQGEKRVSIDKAVTALSVGLVDPKGLKVADVMKLDKFFAELPSEFRAKAVANNFVLSAEAFFETIVAIKNDNTKLGSIQESTTQLLMEIEKSIGELLAAWAEQDDRSENPVPFVEQELVKTGTNN